MGMKNAERQRRWRENHPEAAAQAAKDIRDRKAGMARRPVRVGGGVDTRRSRPAERALDR